MSTITVFLLLVSYLASVSIAQNTTGLFNLEVNLRTVQISDARGNRSVGYYVNNGYAIVEGDVVYGTEADLLAHVVGSSSSNSTIPRMRRRSKSIFRNSNEWPGGTVLYQYESAAMKSAFQPAVDGAIAKWTSLVPCLHFKEQPVGAGSPNGVIVIRAGNPVIPACSAPIGYSSGPMSILLVNGCGVPELTHELVSASNIHSVMLKTNGTPGPCSWTRA
jgi:hypothetical protein